MVGLITFQSFSDGLVSGKQPDPSGIGDLRGKVEYIWNWRDRAGEPADGNMVHQPRGRLVSGSSRCL
ncbi:uncharacterized protein AFUA_1G01400 [Aspergillus fumigatus Af293]|uniref:Uncharacterized protein n=2 Tax=Aspergillus fumigatus TaxID=746128 RepID=Q4WKT0_ASPFU|nr:hypothetical protein AFUA_1G01400 [Aspergillus fumigatus Af293]EAL87852.1 hypothetical protein AFUA_1G01400 [Aspergillus fumigatus Af293]EDP49906.1 hypothetical protein AFUB_079390 [Aspergillus fumigatus A1163]